MTKKQSENNDPEMVISDEDVYSAMQEIDGYLDITASDFKLLYNHAYQHALQRLNLMTVGELASRQVVSVLTTTPLVEVARKMAEARISGVPVLDEQGMVAGMISERDFLRQMGADNQSFMAVVASCLLGKSCVTVPIRKAQADDIMSSPVITIREGTLMMEAATLLRDNDINRLPVLKAEGDDLIGILTRTDLVNAHVLQSGGKA